jgi:hypothetical protein
MALMDSQSTPFAEVSRTAVFIISWCVSSNPLLRRCKGSSAADAVLFGISMALPLHLGWYGLDCWRHALFLQHLC